MKIHIQDGDLHLTRLRTRMPFKYGIATMTSTPHAFLRLRVEGDGKSGIGIAADSLPPKWFTKDPARALDEEVAEMLRVIEHALDCARGLHAESPFDSWRQLYDLQARWGHDQKLPALLSHFGTALVERALIDAVCRLAKQPFFQLVRSNQIGMRLGELHPCLAGKSPADFLPEQPLRQITLRQTVGLADPLLDEDSAPHERLDDGLPQSLAACIRSYGLHHFKIKVSGRIDHDRERLRRIARVIEQCPMQPYRFTLDGNEQFHTLAEFQAFWQDLLDDTHLQDFFAHLAFVEQPFHRDVALDRKVVSGLAGWSRRPPIIIDESDGDLESLPQALQLGYAGTSHKNCKGVFKGIANFCLLQQRGREHADQPAIMSGEDLVNIGPVALLQDLTVCALLGLQSVERNGHHYFAGLSMFPRAVQEQVLQAHSDLYHAMPQGWPALRIKDGTIAVDSLTTAPFGTGFLLDVEAFTPRALWQYQ